MKNKIKYSVPVHRCKSMNRISSDSSARQMGNTQHWFHKMTYISLVVSRTPRHCTWASPSSLMSPRNYRQRCNNIVTNVLFFARMWSAYMWEHRVFCKHIYGERKRLFLCLFQCMFAILLEVIVLGERCWYGFKTE